jgi:hypothetical protein
MNPSAFLDVLDMTTKVVFVHVTAGDAGLGMGTGGRKHPLYQAREHGADTAVRFMADADGLPEHAVVSRAAVNGHAIRRVAYKNTVNYALRLPDGSPDGLGYGETGSQSLQRLARGEIEAYAAIDDSTTYRGWSDLVSTLRAIIECERRRCPDLDLHIPELDATINPDDHPDHVATARAALEAGCSQAGVRWFHHVSYASSALPENLASHERDMKSSVFAVTVAGILAFDHHSSWRHYDQAFVGRNYVRIERGASPSEQGSGAIVPAH